MSDKLICGDCGHGHGEKDTHTLTEQIFNREQLYSSGSVAEELLFVRNETIECGNCGSNEVRWLMNRQEV